MDIAEHLISISLGVRFRANFIIDDELGAIVDHLLYQKGSFFTPERFPKVRNKLNEKALINDQTNDYLLINNSNIILNYGVANRLDDPISIEYLIGAFEEGVIEGVLGEYKISQMNRLGYIRRYSFSEAAFVRNFIGDRISIVDPEADSLNLTYSKRLPLTEALARKSVNDYSNVILNFNKPPEADSLTLSVDYQRYFDPFVEYVDQLRFEEFISDAHKYNENRIPPLLAVESKNES
tara:strand:- start:477 stop:1187 length:711 start_codon:yes stop_codon:yes gene_type:complete